MQEVFVIKNTEQDLYLYDCYDDGYNVFTCSEAIVFRAKHFSSLQDACDFKEKWNNLLHSWSVLCFRWEFITIKRSY